MGFIYKITNKINNKAYIGKTEGNPFDRWRQHYYTATAKEDIGFALTKAIKKYGIENFIFEVLESNIPAQDIDNREKYYIQFYNTLNTGYNLTIGGDGVTTFSHYQIKEYYLQNPDIKKTATFFNCSETTVRRVLKEYNLYTNFNNQGNSREICQYDLHKDLFLNCYPSISAAAKALNKNTGTPIKEACEKKASQAYGYRWKYKDDLTPLQTAVSGSTKKVAQIDIKTEKIIHIFNSAKEAGDTLKIDSSSIAKVCRGTRKTCGGFKWSYYEENY